MHCWRLPPALSMLFRLQSSAKIARLKNGFSTPRKMVLSTIAVLLAITWMSNAVPVDVEGDGVLSNRQQAEHVATVRLGGHLSWPLQRG